MLFASENFLYIIIIAWYLEMICSFSMHLYAPLRDIWSIKIMFQLNCERV